jgi:hypothetical protein
VSADAPGDCPLGETDTGVSAQTFFVLATNATQRHSRNPAVKNALEVRTCTAAQLKLMYRGAIGTCLFLLGIGGDGGIRTQAVSG